MAATKLAKYQEMRDFTQTAEPSGNDRVLPSEQLRFVIQKHAASHLHFDLRLEHAGSFRSWAVPKGPSLDSHDRRLAMEVEDHPLDYGDFEGTIPKGQYGGGTVMLWDRGYWAPEPGFEDIGRALEHGELKFVMEGERVHGSWVLVRTRRDERGRANWILIKHRDSAVVQDNIGGPGVDDRSVASGRTMAEIEAGEGRAVKPFMTAAALPAGAVWQSNRDDHPAADPKPAPAGGGHSAIVVAKAPQKAHAQIGDVELSHPDRELWPGITKRELAVYWLAVAPRALPGLAARPLAIVRCPDGVGGKQQFYQKSGHGFMPPQIREGDAAGQPFLAIDDAAGLVALTQISAIELHPWGASEAQPRRPDRIVFDLDPGEGVAFDAVVAAALEVRARLKALKLASFCRTTGGKGLHVVVPLRPEADWEVVKPFCRAFAETMAQDEPTKFLAHLKIADRSGRILVDWLRNGLGATAVSSYCPRARPGAGVATPLAWTEVKPGLDPAAFTVHTVPKRVAGRKRDPWAEFDQVDQGLPDLAPKRPTPAAAAKPQAAGARIVVARKPQPLSRDRR